MFIWYAILSKMLRIEKVLPQKVLKAAILTMFYGVRKGYQVE